jgi:hypothetical protein
MLASAVAVGLLVGLASGGNWRRLGDLRIRWWAIFLVAIGLRVAAGLLASTEVARAIYVVSLFALVAVAIRNLALRGAPLIAAGIAANAAVISMNGGAMPVSVDAIARAGVRAPSDPLHEVTASASPLGDVIPIPPLGVYSIGDVLLALGVFVLIVWTMKGSAV